MNYKNEQLKAKKIRTSDITKEQLENLYFTERMSMNEIGRHFGFRDQQPIVRLFKKYGIKCRPQTETNKKRHESLYIPERYVIENLLMETNSVSKCAEMLGVGKAVLYRWISIYDIEKPLYFTNSHIDFNEVRELSYTTSYLELSKMYDISVRDIKRRIGDPNDYIFSVKELFKIFDMLDMNNQGLTKQLTMADSRISNSIIFHTRDHKLQSTKLTERIYRLIHNYKPDDVDVCVNTKGPLKFYTLVKGYGNSELMVTRKGFVYTDVFNIGYSKISQQLFWDIYKNIDDGHKNHVKFAELNNEYKIKIDETLITKDTNKYSYSADFVLNKKNIEFDGYYWHGFESIKAKDRKRDEVLSCMGYDILRIEENDYRENPKQILQKCLDFLNQ